MYAHGFRFYFTPLSGVLFAFPSRYWFTIGRSVVFSLGGWSPHVQTGFHVPRLTRGYKSNLTCTGLSPTLAGLSMPFQLLLSYHWPGPRSLATTNGVSVDVLSSGYLDVSVPRVRLAILCIQMTIPPKRWVSPFGNPRIKACLSAPRGLSQTNTSFIAFCRQGIHRVRLVTWSYNLKPSRLLFSRSLRCFGRLLRSCTFEHTPLQSPSAP